MNDIDFDELDQAVTSLLGKSVNNSAGNSVKESQPPQPQPEQSSPQVNERKIPSPQPIRRAEAPSLGRRPMQAVRQPSAESADDTNTNVATSERYRGSTSATSQVGPVSPRAIQKSEPKPSAIATPSQLGAESTKFPITPSAPASGREVKPLSRPSAASVSSNAPPAKPQPSATSSSSAALKPKPSSALHAAAATGMSGARHRPGGRFMDVVHPAASKPKEPIKPKEPPVKPVVQKPTSQSTIVQGGRPPVPDAPKSEAGRPPQIKAPSLPQNPLANRPNRISHAGKTISAPSAMPSQRMNDFVPRKPQSTATPSVVSDKLAKTPESSASMGGAATSSAPIEKASHAGSTTANKANGSKPEDITSPFLNDAKVQKRPLGGSTSAPAVAMAGAATKPIMSSQSVTTFPQKEEAREVDEQLAPTPHSLPPELAQDIVAVEARDPKSSGRPDTPLAFAPEKPKEVKPAPAATRPAAQPVSAATLSIPQQYRAKQSETDKTPRSIYDTAEYHKPLSAAAPKKKKTHPVVWTLLIVLLLAVGAGLGVAVYFLFG